MVRSANSAAARWKILESRQLMVFFASKAAASATRSSVSASSSSLCAMAEVFRRSRARSTCVPHTHPHLRRLQRRFKFDFALATATAARSLLDSSTANTCPAPTRSLIHRHRFNQPFDRGTDRNHLGRFDQATQFTSGTRIRPRGQDRQHNQNETRRDTHGEGPHPPPT